MSEGYAPEYSGQKNRHDWQWKWHQHYRQSEAWVCMRCGELRWFFHECPPCGCVALPSPALPDASLASLPQVKG